jgi:hypothetical protein
MAGFMRPGQLEPNEFEVTILQQMSRKVPALAQMIGELRVLSRKFTGVGCFTEFQRNESDKKDSEEHITLDAVIRMPGVPSGMGAALFLTAGRPRCLETFTFGGEHWDGVVDGFSIEAA